MKLMQGPVRDACLFLTSDYQGDLHSPLPTKAKQSGVLGEMGLLKGRLGKGAGMEAVVMFPLCRVGQRRGIFTGLAPVS